MEPIEYVLHRLTARLQAIDMATQAMYELIGQDAGLAARLRDRLQHRVAQMQAASQERPDPPSAIGASDVRDQAYADTLSRYWAALEPPASPAS